MQKGASDRYSADYSEFRSANQSHNKDEESGAPAPGAVHVGEQNEYN
jgi:hypothetical protein